MDVKEYSLKVKSVCDEFIDKKGCFNCPLFKYACGSVVDVKYNIDEVIKIVEDYRAYVYTWKSKLLEILPLAEWDKRCPSDFFGDVAINQDCKQECINVDDETCMKCWERPYTEGSNNNE